jgi:hypothetical protein
MALTTGTFPSVKLNLIIQVVDKVQLDGYKGTTLLDQLD